MKKVTRITDLIVVGVNWIIIGIISFICPCSAYLTLWFLAFIACLPSLPWACGEGYLGGYGQGLVAGVFAFYSLPIYFLVIFILLLRHQYKKK